MEKEELPHELSMLMFFRQSELLNTVPRLSNVHFKVGCKGNFYYGLKSELTFKSYYMLKDKYI
jgi:hypothetical protein